MKTFELQRKADKAFDQIRAHRDRCRATKEFVAAGAPWRFAEGRSVVLPLGCGFDFRKTACKSLLQVQPAHAR